MNRALLAKELWCKDTQKCNVIFTDASWTKGDAGIAAISIDIHTKCWFIKSQKIQTQSALEAEFHAILLALTRAIDLGWQEVHILSDSKIAVQAYLHQLESRIGG
ncbi:hypothetical protein F8388_015943 [Cannabis sativa]|uniref:RNase H type-1 domain-containing protein n=1 Tax=Cannabis sativa TaxID=3483 RepID=A0A7J6EEW8_CANSA|nr:hypothetical protein F8388_015943 [Cannabis sativa]